MTKLALIITTLVLAQVATFAAIDVTIDNKQGKIEFHSDNSAINYVSLDRVEGGLYSTQITTPASKLYVSTRNLAKGVYMVRVSALNGEEEVDFLNVQ